MDTQQASCAVPDCEGSCATTVFQNLNLLRQCMICQGATRASALGVLEVAWGAQIALQLRHPPRQHVGPGDD
jgi:hypothetical protein